MLGVKTKSSRAQSEQAQLSLWSDDLPPASFRFGTSGWAWLRSTDAICRHACRLLRAIGLCSPKDLQVRSSEASQSNTACPHNTHATCISDSEEPGERTFDRILLLRIEPSSVEDKNKPATSGGIAGTFRWLAGPGEAMANVRSASQLERGNLETDLASLYLKVTPKDDATPDHDEPVLLGMKSGGEQAQKQSVIEIPEFGKRKFSNPQIRKNWERMLDKFKAFREEPSDRQQSNLPKATIDEGSSETSNDPAAIVQTITFVDANQSIPLNWKLSNWQKLGYLLAWELCAGEGTPLRETLDRYFHRTDSSNE